MATAATTTEDAPATHECEEFPHFGIITTCHLDSPKNGFIDSIVCFVDGSLWQLTRTLSHVRYHLKWPPYEATQVFACVCLKDPAGKYANVPEAVMKMKYQVMYPDGEYDLSLLVKALEQAVQKNPESAELLEDLDIAKEKLRLGATPIEDVPIETIKEIKALKYFARTNCEHAPHLLDFTVDFAYFGVDEYEMKGGYVSLILMTKVPGEQLTYEKYWKLSLDEREMIRGAFKDALVDVWRHRVKSLDSGLRNIVWDEEQRKCYIVDFEDFTVVRYDDAAAAFEDRTYEYWGLAEDCFRE